MPRRPGVPGISTACPAYSHVPEVWKASIGYAAVTDVGMRRSNNQDSHAVVKADTRERFVQRGHLFVVADGMGAHAAGELASRIAADQIPLYYLRSGSGDPIAALRSAVQQANTDIYQRGQQNQDFHNMGTTASTLVILPEGAVVAHVGDSRIYRIRRGKLEQLTFDHSLVWEMRAAGQLKGDAQLGHAIPKNIITRSLGPSPAVQIDLEGPFPIEAGDRFLLCSDGLTGELEDEEIGPLLACLPIDLAARVMVDVANLRGGPDNITAIVVEVSESSSTAPQKRAGSDTVSRPIMAAAAFCAAAALLLAVTGNIGPAIVAVLLSAIAAVISLLQARGQQPADADADRVDLPAHRRRGPYRACSAKPSTALLRKLNDVLLALKAAAAQRQWDIDWHQVDQWIEGESRLRKQGKLAEAMQLQAEAIASTMQQLRNQQPGRTVKP